MVHFGACAKAMGGGGHDDDGDEPVICRASRQLTRNDIGKEIAFFCLSPAVCRLPPSGRVGRGYNVMIYNAGRGVLTLAPGHGETVGSAAAAALSQGQWCWIRANEGGWKVVSGFYNPVRARGTPSGEGGGRRRKHPPGNPL